MRSFRVLISAFIASCAAFAQNYTISTFAGGGLPVNIPGTSASIGQVSAVATDSAGNLFFASRTGNTVLRLDATTGLLGLVAGNGTAGFSGDGGPAASAQLSFPSGVAVDSAGSVYIADLDNARIRKVSNGLITTVAGNGTAGFSGDNGPAASASITAWGVAMNATGDLYVVSLCRIRKVSNGIITTVAGSGTCGFSGDNGPATSAQLNIQADIGGVAIDGAGNLYIADGPNHRIRKVSNGVINTVAGNGTAGFSGDNGPATSASLNYPKVVVVDSAGNLYVGDQNNRVREISNGVITTIAGGGTGTDGGPATGAQLGNILGLAFDPVGNLLIAESGNRIRKVSGGVITTVVGNGTTWSGGDNGPALGAQLSSPQGVSVDSKGNLYIADSANSVIREVSNGTITSIAGDGTGGFSGDGGPAISAQLLDPLDIALDIAGNLYIADWGNRRVREVAGGTITTIAGSGSALGDNGPATSAQTNPHAIAVDAAGNVYIADLDNKRIRKISNGVITTVVGNGTQGSTGDGGPATTSQLNDPVDVAVDSVGTIYIAESGARIRKVANGVITTIVGTGTPGFSGDGGPASNAQIGNQTAIAVDSTGNLYIADSYNSRVRKVANGVITTIAGNGISGFSGDGGPATSAQLSYPFGIAVDSVGRVYLADTNNYRIRLLTPLATTCSYSLNPISLQAPVSGGSFSISIETTTGCSWTVSGLPNWITLSGSSSGSGPASVTLAVAPNTSTQMLSATVLIAGVSLPITEAGAASSGCTYTINPGGQAFAATGGSGTISVSAGAGCVWNATNSLSWVSISGASSGTGNGTISYTVAANNGADRSGSITIAGLSFSIEQVGAPTGFTSTGSMAQLAFAGSWVTTYTLINTSSAAVQARLNFFDNNGNPLAVPLVFPQSPAGAGPLVAATLDRTVGPGAGLVIQTASLPGQQTQVGWAQLLSSGSLGGFAVFQQTIGTTIQEGVVPLENRNPAAFEVWFDNTGGYATGIALANAGSQAANIPLVIHDDTGAVLLSATTSLPAMGHTSFDLAGTYALTAGKRGTVEFDTPSGGQISVLGLRFNPTGAFSSVPAQVR
jgi:sugar lactone lactonase YvrE